MMVVLDCMKLLSSCYDKLIYDTSIYCRFSLRRYRYPTDDTLREAAGLAKNGKKKGKHDEKQDPGFLVPKNAEFQVRVLSWRERTSDVFRVCCLL